MARAGSGPAALGASGGRPPGGSSRRFSLARSSADGIIRRSKAGAITSAATATPEASNAVRHPNAPIRTPIAGTTRTLPNDVPKAPRLKARPRFASNHRITSTVQGARLIDLPAVRHTPTSRADSSADRDWLKAAKLMAASAAPITTIGFTGTRSRHQPMTGAITADPILMKMRTVFVSARDNPNSCETGTT
jgi:hypothetical protein